MRASVLTSFLEASPVSNGRRRERWTGTAGRQKSVRRNRRRAMQMTKFRILSPWQACRPEKQNAKSPGNDNGIYGHTVAKRAGHRALRRHTGIGLEGNGCGAGGSTISSRRTSLVATRGKRAGRRECIPEVWGRSRPRRSSREEEAGRPSPRTHSGWVAKQRCHGACRLLSEDAP